MSPKYDLDKIKFATDPATFERAVDLYTSGKVTKFKEKEGVNVYSAVVQGGQPYHVSVEARRYGCGHCDCYLGKKNTLCKHIVAVALYAVMDGQPLSDEDKKSVNNPTSSGHLGDLTKEELVTIKKAITYGLRYIKPYNGPSRLWFSYQNSLQEGCGRLAKIVSDLPVNKKTAQILVTLLLRLDEKLTRGGVDDSDGTVGGFIQQVVEILSEYAELDPSCIETFKILAGRPTCFGWEEPLVRLVDEG